jgi:hypothetical protein
MANTDLMHNLTTEDLERLGFDLELIVAWVAD